jgi:hypothetical protein
MDKISVDTSVLPYRINGEDLRIAVDKIRKLGSDSLDAALKSKKIYVQSALQTLGLTTGDLELTERGRDLAYGRDDGSEKDVFLRVLLDYPPFRRALTQCIGAGSESSDTDSISAFWGKSRVGVSDQNRRDGALVFLHLSGAAGLGSVLVGRSGAKTRIVWNTNAADRVGMVSGGRDTLAAVEQIGSPSAQLAPSSAPSEQKPVRSTVELAPNGRAETFRLVFRRGYGKLEIPVDLGDADLSILATQVDAILALLKARAAIQRIEDDEAS